jgi:putative membrane protein
MSKLTSRLFTQADRDRITAAVKQAESQTAGEIVPYAVEQSDTYEGAVWRAALFFALVTLTVFVLIGHFNAAWLPALEVIALSVTVAAGAGLLLVHFTPALKCLFAGSIVIDLRVAQRVAEAFLAEEVFNIRDCIGILIFLSLLERRVQVVGDSGINEKVSQVEWDDVAQRVVAGIRSGKPAEGLIAAIQQCGVLLQKRGVERRPDDIDELSSSMRLDDPA